MPKVKKKNKVGFTLVELLCAISILGVVLTLGVFSSYRLINKSHNVHRDQQERIVIMTAKSYIQDHKEDSPKLVGESRNIKVKTLKDTNYLKEDIYDSYGKQCMSDSYVRVYKLSDTEYTYIAYIYCGDEKVDEVEEVPSPTIKIYYADSSYNKVESDSLKSIIDSKFYIELTGGITKNGNLLDIDKYKYTISIKKKKDTDYTEVYNSNFINTNRNQSISLVKDFKDYINEDDISSVKINIEVFNTVGAKLELSSYIQNKK